MNQAKQIIEEFRRSYKPIAPPEDSVLYPLYERLTSRGWVVSYDEVAQGLAVNPVLKYTTDQILSDPYLKIDDEGELYFKYPVWAVKEIRAARSVLRAYARRYKLDFIDDFEKLPSNLGFSRIPSIDKPEFFISIPDDGKSVWRLEKYLRENT
jgi:hypothetical protein